MNDCVGAVLLSGAPRPLPELACHSPAFLPWRGALWTLWSETGVWGAIFWARECSQFLSGFFNIS